MNSLLRAAVLFAAVLPATEPASGFPVTVIRCSQPVTFNQAPKRAVINDVNMAEMAFALQLQPAIVGLTGISGWYKTTPAFQARRDPGTGAQIPDAGKPAGGPSRFLLRRLELRYESGR